jgi:hypothetical protein
MIVITMRITIRIPDDLGDAIRSFATARGISPGEAVEELARRGLRMQASPFPCFSVPDGAAPITLQQTLAAAHNGVLATLDRGIVSLARHCPERLELLLD